MKKVLAVFAALSSFYSVNAMAMCGCMLPPRPPPSMRVANSKLTNKSSKVIIVHDGDRTVVTMANDFDGDAKSFGIVIPVPSAITKEQIHVGEKTMVETLAQATAPQLLEYPAIDPCMRMAPSVAMDRAGSGKMESAAPGAVGGARGPGHTLQVTVEGTYTVGEYDIQILTAENAGDLITWLKQHDYQIPDGAEPVFASYLRQNMHFFLAKVNLKQQASRGYTFLRPIQIAYESPKFMLPIRLGMLNAEEKDGAEQELSVWTITKKGRVESTNYRTVKMPVSQGMLPEYVKNDFEGVYRAAFKNLERREGNDVVFYEYAGYGSTGPIGSANTDPETLRKLGVWWADGTSPAFITRLHFTYDKAHFPEDLVLQETSDSAQTQPVFSVQDDPKSASCMSKQQLHDYLNPGHAQQAQALASLTGWDADDIMRQIDKGPSAKPEETPANKTPDGKDRSWYQNLWK